MVIILSSAETWSTLRAPILLIRSVGMAVRSLSCIVLHARRSAAHALVRASRKITFFETITPSNQRELSRHLEESWREGCSLGKRLEEPSYTFHAGRCYETYYTTVKARQNVRLKMVAERGGGWLAPDAPFSTQPAKLHEIRTKEGYNGITICAMLCSTVCNNDDGLGGCDVMFSPGGIV